MIVLMGTPPATRRRASAGVLVMMKIVCSGAALWMTSMTFWIVKKRMWMLPGMTVFMSAWAMGSAADASSATMTVFTPRALIQSWP